MLEAQLILVSGPAGVGKTTLTKTFLQEVPSAARIPLYTTRPPRHGEISGIDYHFISQQDFIRMDKSNHFLTRAKCRGYNYGIRTLDLYNNMVSHSFALLDVHWSTALFFQSVFSNCISFYLVAPSESIRIARLRNRNHGVLSVADYAPASRTAASFFSRRITTHSIEQTLNDVICSIKGN